MAPKYNFDQAEDRRASDSAKWNYFPDALPMWVADMDFQSPPQILAALHKRVDEGIFGYALELPALKDALVSRLAQRYGWHVAPEEIVLLPGLVSGLNVVTRAIGAPGDGVLINTPVYPPFLTAPPNQGRELHTAEQYAAVNEAGQLDYQIDFEALEAAIQPNTRLFILCNPHNPTGRVYTRGELLHLADICARHDLVICADEIHAELLMAGATHIPIATLAPEIAARTITLLAPSKTFNIPGLGCSLAVIQDLELRKQFEAAGQGIVPHVNLLGMYAALAAYTECDEWLAELLVYLEANRDFAVEYITRHLPGIRTTVPAGTYLLWLDCRATGLEDPFTFCLEEAGVALNDGASFGPGGEGFVRLNLGCTRATLTEALERLGRALTRR